MWRRVQSTAQTVTLQRWWGAASSPPAADGTPNAPTRGIVHSAILLQRLLGAKGDENGGGGDGAAARVSVSDLRAADWAELFTAALHPAVSIHSGCFTFCASDWHCFAALDALASAQPAPPMPVFNVLMRHQDDFHYNNHIYEAVRRTTEWRLLAEAARDGSAGAGPPGGGGVDAKGPSLSKAAHDMAEYAEEHKQCALLAVAATPPAALSRCVDENLAVAELLRNARTSDEVRGLDAAGGGLAVNFFPHRSPPSHVAYQSKHFFAIVNLKPVERAGHLLLIPKVTRGTLFEAFEAAAAGTEGNSADVVLDLGETICKCIAALNRQRADVSGGKPCSGFSVVVQQGRHAGQTVPCLHVHVIAMVVGQGLLSSGSSGGMVVDPDADPVEAAQKLEAAEQELRKPRTPAMMTEEAQLLRSKYLL